MPKPDNVGVGTATFIWSHQGEVLMNCRAGAHGAGSWCPPGGWLDYGENLADGSAREVFEETTLEVFLLEQIHTSTELFPDRNLQSVTTFHECLPEDWRGTPRVPKKERGKFKGDWQWVDPKNLPSPLFGAVPEMVGYLEHRSAAIRAGTVTNRNEAKAFADYIAMERRQMRLSPFASSRSLQDWLKLLDGEVREAVGAAEFEASNAIAEELADVLGVTIRAILKAEQEGHCTLQSVIQGVHKKILRRKPWLEDGTKVPETVEEEIAIWNRVKAEEKEANG
jgi:8-oxo-dGTP diphosphatase